jgi:hypothetical protein
MDGFDDLNLRSGQATGFVEELVNLTIRGVNLPLEPGLASATIAFGSWRIAKKVQTALSKTRRKCDTEGGPEQYPAAIRFSPLLGASSPPK